MRGVSARWAVSFADLCLLLLGFLIIAQAKPDRAKLAAGISGTPSPDTSKHAAVVAARLFEPGEAVLTAAGRREIAAFAARASASASAVRVDSIGADPATTRLDAWELAAARAAALARALVANGIGEERIKLAVDRTESHPQRLSLLAQ